MALFATQYPNNSRTVIGTPVIFNDDSILLCDTALAPVVINLLDIPNDYWNTPWKLYVVDKSNNASINNITINAGAGQTINGASSITLSVNGECALIRIVGNTQFVAQLSASGATIGGHIIQDEGVSLTQRPYLNFIGPGVVASDNAISGKTDVTISGGFVVVTYAQLTTLANANGLFPGTNYSITDAEFGSTPIIPTNVVVTAITTNKVSLSGQGIFFNADYQGVGDYSGVPTYSGTNLGIWTSTLPVVVGDVCIWSNFMYLNLTGANGVANPETDAVNWQLIPYSVTKGYILEVDAIEYQQSTNWIISRTDNRFNLVERAIPSSLNSLNRFPWGNSVVSLNSVTKNSNFDICNCKTKLNILANTLINTELTFGLINLPCAVGSMLGNTLTNVTGVFQNSCKAFNENVIVDTQLNTIEFNDGPISNNNIFDSAITITNNGGFITNNDIVSSTIIVAFNSGSGTINFNTFSTSSMSISGSNSGSIEYNKVLSSSSITMLNNVGIIGKFDPKGGSNILEQSAQLIIETNNGVFYGNAFKNATIVNISINNSEVSSNNWYAVTFTLSNNNFGVGKTTATGLTFNANILTKQINAGIGDFGINTIGYDLDCSDPTIYDGGTNTLTIPGTIATFFGFYELKNAGGKTINKINNLSSGWSTQFVNDAGNTTFNSVAIAGAVASQIVSTSGLAAFVVKYRLNGTDSISLQLNGTFCAVTQSLIYT